MLSKLYSYFILTFLRKHNYLINGILNIKIKYKKITVIYSNTPPFWLYSAIKHWNMKAFKNHSKIINYLFLLHNLSLTITVYSKWLLSITNRNIAKIEFLKAHEGIVYSNYSTEVKNLKTTINKKSHKIWRN